MEDRVLLKYKRHPRILEIRFIVLLNNLETELGVYKSRELIEYICGVFNCNYARLYDVFEVKNSIRRMSKTKTNRWRQEVIFMGLLYGKSLYEVCKYYLKVASSNIYTDRNMDIKNFVTSKWLQELDSEVQICSDEDYKIEIIRFLEAFDTFANSIETVWC